MSEPRKLADGTWIIELDDDYRVAFEGHSVRIDNDMSSSGYRADGSTRGESCSAEASDVLRLLAAEASDRLKLEWKMRPTRYGGEGMSDHDMGDGAHDYWFANELGQICWQECNACGGEVTPDEMLARLHGKFLLEAAMKAANVAKDPPPP